MIQLRLGKYHSKSEFQFSRLFRLGIWITIGVSAFILIMFVVAACVRYHRKKPTTHQAELIDNPKENAEKSILVTE